MWPAKDKRHGMTTRGENEKLGAAEVHGEVVGKRWHGRCMRGARVYPQGEVVQAQDEVVWFDLRANKAVPFCASPWESSIISFGTEVLVS